MNVKYDALLGQVRADDSYDDSQTAEKLEAVEQRIEALENTETDVPVEDVVYVADYDALQELADPQETVLYITEDTGLLYMYRNGSFEVIEGHQQGNTIFFSGEFGGLSELLKTYTDSSAYNVVLVQGSGVMATYRFVVNNSNNKVMQTLCKDQRDGTSANVRTRTGKNYNAQTGTWTWTGWKLRTPVYKEELDSSLIPGSANAVTGGAVATALSAGLNSLQHPEVIDCTYEVISEGIVRYVPGDIDALSLPVGTYRLRLIWQMNGQIIGTTSGILYIAGVGMIVMCINPATGMLNFGIKQSDENVWNVVSLEDYLSLYFASLNHSHNYSEIEDMPDLSDFVTQGDLSEFVTQSDLSSTKSELESSIRSCETNIDEHETRIAENESGIDGHESRIQALEARAETPSNYGTVVMNSDGTIESYPAEWDNWFIRDTNILPIEVVLPNQGSTIGAPVPGVLLVGTYLLGCYQMIKYSETLGGDTYTKYKRLSVGNIWQNPGWELVS